jgi:hypothetical protein
LSHALRGEDLSFDAPGTKARCEEIAKAGGVAAVLGAMAAHPTSERVQSAGAEALRRMAESSDAARVALCSAPEKLMGLGGVPVLIRAMSTNPDSPEIAEAAGSVLVAVAKQGDEGEKAVGKEGRAARIPRRTSRWRTPLRALSPRTEPTTTIRTRTIRTTRRLRIPTPSSTCRTSPRWTAS